jgi:predicted HAD superfamily Cof-like phosphohydrolase
MTGTPVCTVPAFPSDDRVELRESLIREEVIRELLPALARRDMIEVADGIIDAIYVLIGAGLELGLPMSALWDEIQGSNLAKGIKQADGSYKVVRRPDGKILKGPDWTPPDIAGVLRAHGWKG